MSELRLQSEIRFHDRQAWERSLLLDNHPDQLRFTDDDYLNHESWIRPAMAEFGQVAGKSILDMGCGHGMASVVLARAGANVTAFDLSSGYVKEAIQRAVANKVNVTHLQADAEYLPFADHSFDAIWGNAVLHHLDITRAGREIRRVLRADGVAVFCEPWGENPLLNLARQQLPYSGKHHTVDEKPLCFRDLKPLRDMFPIVDVRGYQLLSMIRRVISSPPIISFLETVDKFTLRMIPGMWRWCRYVVIVCRSEPERKGFS